MRLRDCGGGGRWRPCALLRTTHNARRTTFASAALAALALAPAQPTQASEAGQAAADSVFAHPTSGRALLETTLAGPAQVLARARVLKGTFTHARHLSEMPRPLAASGEFVFARDLGVWWRTTSPFESVLVLTDEGIVQRDEGVESLRLSAAEQPAVRLLASIFLALFTLDVRALEANFDLHGKSHGERWLVGLKPRSSAIANVFDRATLSGAQQVEQIVLTDARGDRTVIELHGVEASDAPPDAAVRALFAR